MVALSLFQAERALKLLSTRPSLTAHAPLSNEACLRFISDFCVLQLQGLAKVLQMEEVTILMRLNRIKRDSTFGKFESDQSYELYLGDFRLLAMVGLLLQSG
jgi:hypothetical protein